VQAGTFTKVKIAGRGNVPADAVGVELNVTPIENEGRGFATPYPCTATRPTASTLNYTPGVNIANATIVALNTTGEVCIYTHATSHYALDVVAHLQRYQEPGSRVDYPTGDSPYWVASDGTNIWIASNGSNTVSKMNPADGTRVDYPTGGNPYWVAFDGTSVWITNRGSNTVSKMNPG